MAARARLAAKGLSFSMRELATDAGVNLGLIHKHLGNKEDVVRAVLARNNARSAAAIQGIDSLPEAVHRLFLVGVADPQYVRIVAWLILHDRVDLLPNSDADEIAAITRLSSPSVDGRVRLMTALSAIAGWSLFGDGILRSSEIPDEAHRMYENHIAELLSAIVQDEDRAN